MTNNWKHTTAATVRGFDPLKKYVQAQADAAKRGVEFKLTFGEWFWYWLQSGKWEQRGKRKGEYVMSRHGPDIGPYERGNVHIQLATKNVSEKYRPVKPKPVVLNPHSADRKQKMQVKAKARTGRNFASQPCVADGVFYNSQRDAADALGITGAALSYRLSTGKPGYQRL